MLLARKVIEAGHSLRKEQQLKLRQPLAALWFSIPEKSIDSAGVLSQLLEELNVKTLIAPEKSDAFMKQHGVQSKEIDGVWIWLDTTISPELQAEGEARDIVRKIQEERKKMGTGMADHVTVTLPAWPATFTDYIKTNALADTITKGETFGVTKI